MPYALLVPKKWNRRVERRTAIFLGTGHQKQEPATKTGTDQQPQHLISVSLARSTFHSCHHPSPPGPMAHITSIHIHVMIIFISPLLPPFLGCSACFSQSVRVCLRACVPACVRARVPACLQSIVHLHSEIRDVAEVEVEVEVELGGGVAVASEEAGIGEAAHPEAS